MSAQQCADKCKLGKGVQVNNEPEKPPEVLMEEGERMKRDLKLTYNPYKGLGESTVLKDDQGWPILSDTVR